jgi:hypothetical protein
MGLMTDKKSSEWEWEWHRLRLVDERSHDITTYRVVLHLERLEPLTISFETLEKLLVGVCKRRIDSQKNRQEINAISALVRRPKEKDCTSRDLDRFKLF